MIGAVKRTVKALSSVHLPDGRPNVFLYSTPRSGSTWLMELIWSQPGFKTCNQPLYLESPAVRRHLGIEDWVTLYGLEALPRIERYLGRICKGRIGFTNPNPFRRFYRPVTRRIVFKEIHASAEVAELAAERLNCRVLYLIRHPIAVTLSTERWPTLPAFLSSDHRRHFGPEELTLAHRILERGDRLERGVLAWCLQNAVPLRRAGDDWTVVSYEQLVLDPLPAIAELARRLDHPAGHHLGSGRGDEAPADRGRTGHPPVPRGEVAEEGGRPGRGPGDGDPRGVRARRLPRGRPPPRRALLG